MSTDDFLKEADTGDIVLFQTDRFFSKMQRVITGSEYDHVGIIILWETDEDTQEVCMLDCTYHSGVGITKISTPDKIDHMVQTHAKMVYRPLRGFKRSPEFIKEIVNAMESVMGK
jgi:hypothetical protein